ncbi:MAG: hypothetical protein O7A04_09210, partial [Acidobacteria bacterium]|nr:hypothetical protein [Acidobacteriota bacterium]
MTRQISHRLAQLATVGSLFVFARRLAAHHPDGATAAEAEYLALLVATVLLGLALSARTAPAIVSGGALIGIALCLPAAQGTRATLIVALLASMIAWCTWWAFASSRKVAFSEVGGIAIAWQALMRSDRLLDLRLEPGTAVWLVALPLVAAGAAVWLARQHSAVAGLVLLAALCVLIPGLGIVPVAVLLVAAALGARPEVSRAGDAVALGACVLAIWREPEVAPALLALVTALALAHHTRWRWLAPAAALAWAATRILQSGSVEPGATMLGWILLGLPLALLGGPDRRPLALTGLALAVAAAGGEPVILAPAVALLALAVPTEGGARRLQAAWSLVLLTAVAMAAAYPWLRRPLVDPPSQMQ